MVKEISDAKTVNQNLNTGLVDSLLGPCSYDSALDKKVREVYPTCSYWTLNEATRFDMKPGAKFIVIVWLNGEKYSKKLRLKCCHNDEKGYFFISSLPEIKRKTEVGVTKNWFEENETFILELNKKALDHKEISFFIPNSKMQGTPRNVIEELLIKNAFGPTFTDEGVVCTAKETLEL